MLFKFNNTNNIFVFVACGNNSHINTLNFSLKYLKKFSSNKIIVVTDLSRNNDNIEHNNIINIKTPKNFDNHQASIWLKTSLHNILPKGPLYCYLDSDIIAVNQNCNKIFEQFKAPITFAYDHCRMQQFSPYSVNCNCLNNHIKDKNDFETKISEIVNSKNYPPDYSNPNIRKLYSTLQNIKYHPVKNIGSIIRTLLSFLGFELKIKNDLILSKRKKAFILNNEIFEYPSLFFYRKDIKEKTNYSFNWFQLKWLKPDKSEFSRNSCEHLSIAIKNKFGVEINESNWQHWNGGVFLFNEQSHEFMETWHKYTLQIFDDKYWKTRDQGTLIATAWKFGLKNHPTIPQEFNFIADYYKWDIKLKQNTPSIEIISNNKIIKPKFIHVYHEFGNKNWDLWQNIENIHNPEIKSSDDKLTSDNKIVNGLWIGNSLSQLELLTIKSFVNNGHIFYLWTYKPLFTNIPENVIIKDANEIIPENKIFRYKHKNQFGHGKGSLGGFSDIFRYKLLYEYGGWWTDMDVTCLKPLNFKEEYIFRTHHKLKVVGNIMKCPKHSTLMKNCYEKAIKEIDAENKDWHKPIKILVNEIQIQNLENFIVEISNQDRWAIVRKLLTSCKTLPDNWYLIHWINEEWRRNHIRKDFFIKKSTLGVLMLKNGFNGVEISSFNKLLYSYRLLYYVAAIKQLPSFLKRIFN